MVSGLNSIKDIDQIKRIYERIQSTIACTHQGIIHLQNLAGFLVPTFSPR